MTKNRIFKTTGKVILYLVSFVLVLIVAVIIFINTRYGKNVIKNKAESYLQRKLKTKLAIGDIDFSLPKWIALKGIYLEDQKKDTLLYGESVAIDINMLQLISGKIDIGKLAFKNIYANISRPENDSNFNYQFILNAFIDTTNKVEKPIDTAALKITLNKLLLTDIRLKFTDKFGGNEFAAGIKKLNTGFNQFQPDRMRFGLNDFTASGINFTMTTTKEAVVMDTTSSSPMALLFKANNIDLKEVRVNYQNMVNGMYYANNFQHLGVNNINLDMAAENVGIDKILLNNSSVEFTSPKLIASKTGTLKSADTVIASANWKLALNELQLNNDEVIFNNNNTKPQPGFDFAHVGLKKISINTGKVFYSRDSILANIKQITFKDKSGFQIDTTHANIRYTSKGIEATQLYVKTPESVIQNTLIVKYDDVKKITTQPQNSEVNIKLQKTILAVNDIYQLMPMVKKYLPAEKFANNTIRLSTEINGSLKTLNIPSLQLAALSGTVVNAKAILYNVTDSNHLAYDVTVFNSQLPRADLIKFMPANKELQKLPAVINFGTHVKGDIKNTTADISVNSTGFSLAGKGEVKNINNPKALQYNISINNSRIQKSFIVALAPAGTIPATINLPELVTLSGSAKGDMNNVQTNITLGGSYGMAKAVGYVHNFKNTEAASYDMSFETRQLQVGKLIKQDTLIGNLSFSGYAKGRGFNYKTMTANINGNVAAVGLKKYDYKNILVNAQLNNGAIVSHGAIDDDNIKLQYTTTANVKGKYPVVEASVRVDTIQLRPLHLYSDTLNSSFSAYFKAANLDPLAMDVVAKIDSAKININNKKYALDSVLAKAKTFNGVNDISFTSPIADVFANGKFQYDKIGPSLLQYVDKYYNVTDTLVRNIPDQELAFNGNIKKSEIITSLVPGFDYDSISFKGGFSSNKKDSALLLTAAIPYLLYQSNRLSNGTINIASFNNQITGAVNFDTLHFGTNNFYKTGIAAKVAGDSLSISAITKDQKDKDRFAIGGSILQKDKAYYFSLKDTLLLNYKSWTVAPNNKITYSPKGILVTDFLLSADSTKISAASKEPVLNSPIDVAIDNFKIKDLTSMMNSDTLLASGTIGGKFTVGEFDKKLPAFTGNLTVDSLYFMQQPVGTIKLFAEKQGENTIAGNLDLTGNGNNATIKGNYYLNDDIKQFDADINLANLNMATLQAFSQGNLARSSGSIKGKVKLDGKFADPHWNGGVNFDSTQFSLATLGTAYSINQQKIDLVYPKISFPDFTIKDSTNNSMVVSGDITSKSISEYDLNMDIKANQFTLVNVSKAIANQIDGFAAIDADISVKGTSTAPAIEGNISLNDKSDVTMVLPETNVNKDAAKAVVRFIDRDTFALPEKISFRPAAEIKPAFAQFLNYNLNIEVGKKAALTIIIDPSSGDELKIQGDAQLNAGVDPGGNIVLAGNYALSSGYYILNYQFLRKQFDLLPGSTIAFSGTPTNAQIDIKAQYIAKTSSKDLLGNEVGEVDPKVANSFKQELPFKVILGLKGSMMKPDISFDIQEPDENVAMNGELRTTIENKLAQLRTDVAATNKQVFSLLLFNRFVGEQSTDFFKGSGSGDGGGGIGAMAKASVSKFLASALDNIANDVFKGLDINLNLNSYKDYSSGDAQEKTDLNVAVTKSFVNDRLSITVGRNFGIEGQDASAKASQQKGSGFLPDVTVNYKLTQDGKYLLRAYKKTQFEVILDGYVIETGLAFVLTMDYDKFRDLFHKKAKTPAPVSTSTNTNKKAAK